MSAQPDTESLLLTADRDGVLTVTLNRPRAGNALSLAMLHALQAVWERTAADRSTRVVVLAGAGPVFCAGHDLRELAAHPRSPAFTRELITTCNRMILAMTALPQPVIARVHGVATAAGCQLVAAADLAVASTEAKFATPGVNVGTWCATPMVALSRAVARKHAMRFLLTGALQDANTALRIGLVNEVVPAEQLDAAVNALAGEIAAKSPFVIGLGKNAFYRQLEFGLADAYEYAAEVAARNCTAEDAAEGVAAFIEKRAPRWKGR